MAEFHIQHPYRHLPHQFFHKAVKHLAGFRAVGILALAHNATVPGEKWRKPRRPSSHHGKHVTSLASVSILGHGHQRAVAWRALVDMKQLSTMEEVASPKFRNFHSAGIYHNRQIVHTSLLLISSC